MSYKTPENALKSNQIYSVGPFNIEKGSLPGTVNLREGSFPALPGAGGV